MSEITDAVFGEDGILSEKITDYRPRPGQIKMAELVEQSLERDRHAVIEAPTGTGKSFAAGIPAAINSMMEGRTIVYVTANIALQEQLFEKDLPMIRDIVNSLVEGGGDHFKFGLIKGMSNYLCLAELQESRKQKLLPPKWESILAEWSKKTKTGDKGELAEEPPEEIWSKASTSSEDCMRRECAFYDKCFPFKARSRLRDAHLIVTNYHLLFMDRMISMNGGKGILPDYDVIIMDEGHEAPEIAMDFRGHTIGQPRWSRINAAMRRAAEGGRAEAQALWKKLESSTEALGDALAEMAKHGTILEFPLGNDFNVGSVLNECARFLELESAIMREVADKSGDLSDRSRAVRVGMLASQAKKASYDVEVMAYGLIKKEIDAVSSYDPLEGKYVLKTEEILVPGSPKEKGNFPPFHVYYFSQGRHGRAYISCKVLDAAKFLQETIFGPKVAIVTSATLSARGNLEFITNQMGLKKEDYDPLIVESPFDPKNVLVMVPEGDFPSPDEKDFTDCASQAVVGLLNNMESGGMMCLFTSYKNLNAVKKLVTAGELSVKVLVQGEMGKRQIISEFKASHERNEKALILATASFWQGVDIPGQALSVVVIDKIPFVPPDDPVLWYLDRTTDGAFHRYSVPKAIIAMKQGIGRLIRRENDYGAVVILDNRINSKTYGKAIESAFPNECYYTDDFNDVIEFLETKAKDARAQAQ